MGRHIRTLALLHLALGPASTAMTRLEQVFAQPDGGATNDIAYGRRHPPPVCEACRKPKIPHASCDACGGRLPFDVERCPSCGDAAKLSYGFHCENCLRAKIPPPAPRPELAASRPEVEAKRAKQRAKEARRAERERRSREALDARRAGVAR